MAENAAYDAGAGIYELGAVSPYVKALRTLLWTQCRNKAETTDKHKYDKYSSPVDRLAHVLPF